MHPKTVLIHEVGPRDGLQNEKKIIPTNEKIAFINQLSKTGLKTIEVTSFVSAKKIPQLSDHAEVFKGIDKINNIHYPVLVPNLQGLDAAIEAGVREIAVFTAVSETFSQQNINCSIDESFKRIEAIIQKAKTNKLRIRGYLSCVLGCPYEGEIPLSKVFSLSKELFSLGCDELSLGDTIGVGTPVKTQKLIEGIAKEIPISQCAVHFHDTYGQALANIFASLELGIAIIDSSVAGLGGCPYAKGSSGNVATEDVVFMLNGMGIETGVDLKALLDASRFITSVIGHETHSKVARALL